MSGGGTRVRRFKVKVNDEVFEVEVEELRGDTVIQERPVPSTSKAPIPSTNVQARPVAVPRARTPVPPAPRTDARPAPAAGPKPAGDGNTVLAPIPGVVSEVKVAPGRSVKRGEVLILLEAMKMQNEILAPHDAVVEEVLVNQGTSVQTGDALVRFKS